MSLPSVFHKPILVKSIVDFFADPHPSVILDLTCGEGGHSEAFAEAFPDARLICVDRDPVILPLAQERLRQYSDRSTFINANYSNLDAYWPDDSPRCILADLGISSLHFDSPERGFGFKHIDAPLDMRLDGRGYSAADLVNRMEEKQLADLIFHYGEEKLSRRIAAAIVTERYEPIKTVNRLAEIVRAAYPAKLRNGRIHPATRTFQALRIAVNRELDHLDRWLEGLRTRLRVGDRLAIITFHSLEDRPVKQFLRGDSHSQPLNWAPGMPDEPAGLQFSRPSGKPIIPSDEEVADNPRARSAKLRLATVTSIP